MQTIDPSPDTNTPARPKHNLALVMLVGTAIYALICHDLLWSREFGLNITVLALLFVALLFGVARVASAQLRGGGRWMALPLAIFAIAYLIRDSQSLRAYNVLAMLIAAGLMGLRSHTGQVRVASVVSYWAGMASTGVQMLLGAFPLLTNEIDWRIIALWRPWQVWRRVLVGGCITLPLLLMFGGLFASADAGFARILRDIFNINIVELIGRLLLIITVMWLVVGLLSAMLLPIFHDIGKSAVPAFFKLGIVEFGLPLGALVVLFGAFVALQLTYLFGGELMVSVSSGLTYADYARRGFFELVAVAVLLLVVLLLVDWLIAKDDPRNLRLFRALASVLIALMGIVMISAFQRMWLYTQIYGLSELRIYPTAFMIWIALTFGWFVLTILRGHIQRFVFGAAVAGFATLLVLNLINPDALIVRFNAQRAGGLLPLAPRASRSFDTDYAMQLSADAVPALVEVLPNLSEADQAQVRRYLASVGYRVNNWRGFHVGRWWAQQALDALN